MSRSGAARRIVRHRGVTRGSRLPKTGVLAATARPVGEPMLLIRLVGAALGLGQRLAHLPGRSVAVEPRDCGWCRAVRGCRSPATRSARHRPHRSGTARRIDPGSDHPPSGDGRPRRPSRSSPERQLMRTGAAGFERRCVKAVRKTALSGKVLAGRAKSRPCPPRGGPPAFSAYARRIS